jgi:prophage regulatory protein
MEKIVAASPRFIRFPEVQKKVGLCRSTINRREAEGLFPKRFRISQNCVAWRDDEIEDWVRKRSTR